MYNNVYWEQTNLESLPIESCEFSKFLNDTIELLDLLANAHIKDWDKKVRKKIKTYWVTWGPLYPTVNNQISMKTLIEMGQWFFLTQTFWHNQKIPAPAVQLLCEDIMVNSNIILHDGTGTAYWKLEYWPSENRIISFPLNNKPSEDFVFAVDTSDIPADNTRVEEQVEWLRNTVRHKTSDIISKSNVHLKSVTEDDSIFFVGETDNLLLVLLVNMLIFAQDSGKPCACGCKRAVLLPRTRFATDRCAQRHKDQSPRKKIKNWLKSPFHYNEGLTKEEVDKLMDKVDGLLREEKSELEIKSILQPEVDIMKEEKKSGIH